MAKTTVWDIRGEVRRLDSSLTPPDERFKTAVLLLSILVVGPTMARLKEFTGFSNDFIYRRMRELRVNKIVRGNKLACEWDHPEDGAAAFWLDVLVAEGLLRREDAPA